MASLSIIKSHGLLITHLLCLIPFICCHTVTVPRLLVVAFDGFRWDYLKRTTTPHFDKFMKEGVHARLGIKNVFPTETLPNFWTLATGLYPESHGIIGNHLFDPEINKTFVPFYAHTPPIQNDPRFYDSFGAEPIWVTNQRQKNNARSGVVMWVGGNYPVKWSQPDFYMPYNADINSTQRVDTIVRWFSHYPSVNLGLIYFDEPDLIAHRHGPESVEVTNYISKADELLEYILSSLEKKDLLDDINIIITSDHGHASVSRDKLINLDDIIPYGWYDQIISYSPVFSLIPKPGMEDKLFQKLKEAAEKPNSHFKVWNKSDIPESFHYKNNIRVTPFIALADLYYNFLINMTKDDVKSRGNHGYDNELQEMHPFFLAMGPSFKKGYAVDTFNIVDFYPLMCHLLDLAPAPNNGSMNIVSKLLKSHETTMWTFATYIFVLIFISSIGGVYIVSACRQHRYLKRKMIHNRKMTFQGGIRYSVPSKGNAVVRLLSDDEDDDYFDRGSDDDEKMLNTRDKKH